MTSHRTCGSCSVMPTQVSQEDSLAPARDTKTKGDDSLQPDTAVENALERATAVMRGLPPLDREPSLQLGPIFMATVNIEGKPVQALIDTGSRATIVALDTLIQILVEQKPSECTMDEWKQHIRCKLEPSSISLKSYRGGRLQIVKHDPLVPRQPAVIHNPSTEGRSSGTPPGNRRSAPPGFCGVACWRGLNRDGPAAGRLLGEYHCATNHPRSTYRAREDGR